MLHTEGKVDIRLKLFAIGDNSHWGERTVTLESLKQREDSCAPFAGCETSDG